MSDRHGGVPSEIRTRGQGCVFAARHAALTRGARGELACVRRKDAAPMRTSSFRSRRQSASIRSTSRSSARAPFGYMRACSSKSASARDASPPWSAAMAARIRRVSASSVVGVAGVAGRDVVDGRTSTSVAPPADGGRSTYLRKSRLHGAPVLGTAPRMGAPGSPTSPLRRCMHRTADPLRWAKVRRPRQRVS
jgi:hypothetical protein